MNRSSKWDDKTIESHLKRLPKIEDKQNKELLYEKIQERLQEGEVKQRKKKGWFVPTVASAAVLFLLLLLIPSFFNEQDMTLEEPEMMKEEAGMMMDVESNLEEEAPSITSEELFKTEEATDSSEPFYIGALHPSNEDSLRQNLITFAVPAHYPTGELVIPVTTVGEHSSLLENFLAIKNSFNGHRWGIGSFPQIEINSIIEEKGGIAIIDVPANSLESLSSAEDRIYSLALKETFSAQQNFSVIRFTSDGEPGVFWGQNGPLTEIELQDELNRGYYVFTSDTNHKFLVSGKIVDAPFNDSSSGDISLAETLELMKQSNLEQGYTASIPEHVEITNVEQSSDTATITFAEGTVTEDNVDNLIMIEAMMFAAKDFGHFYVQFEGIDLDQIGPYQVKELQVIPNYMNFLQ